MYIYVYIYLYVNHAHMAVVVNALRVYNYDLYRPIYTTHLSTFAVLSP